MLLWRFGVAAALASLSSATDQNTTTTSTIQTTLKTTTSTTRSSADTLSTQASNFSTSAGSPVYCATTTLYASTITFTRRFEATSCTAYSTTTKIPTTTLYTGSFSAPYVFTETLRSYGDLYTSGELASTPTCAPTDCSGTFSTTQSGTQSTMITSGTSTISTVCPTTTYAGSTVSTTQDRRCAPTNLLSTVEGNGIYRPTIAAAGATAQYNSSASDASACCQACVDTANCAAGFSESSSLGEIEICALVIASPDNVLALNYSDSAPFEYSRLAADGNGAYRISYGCGSVQPIVYEDDCVAA
ncbi:hypothetical protein LTR36_004133 [Oleoguttula mirabilis]|uniref:Apple domain-containing protein n=1 Tax=Oleoguttula mirabilis TaxID=1507867 RepID=A0AAV9JI77_9PEZI|nr:hypothetical protein LTR36_004133 [Oleoguttula mirabilis]